MDRVRPQEAFVYPSDQDQGPKSNKIKQEQHEEKYRKFAFKSKELYLKTQVQGKMANTRKKCAPTPTFFSRNQLVLEGFESPFDKRLNPESRLVA